MTLEASDSAMVFVPKYLKSKENCGKFLLLKGLSRRLMGSESARLSAFFSAPWVPGGERLPGDSRFWRKPQVTL